MTALAVLADDLTGALDASAPFAARGLKTLVALSADALPHCLAQNPDVVGLSTDSREIAPEAATEAMRAALAHLPPRIGKFKKIDSRLKGNIAAELDAMDYAAALVVPAIPAFDRRVEGGFLRGFGVAEPIAVAKNLGTHAARAKIPDIVSQADIERALLAYPHDLPVGARGLAEALALRMAPDAPLPHLRIAGKRVIFVIGSRDPITRQQILALRAHAGDCVHIAAPGGRGLATAGNAEIIVIEAIEGEAELSPVAVANNLAETLAQLSPQPGDILVVSGGATAQIVLGHLGIAALELIGEPLPGLPLAHAAGLTIITKSGGFGDGATLVNLLGCMAIGVAT